MSQQSDGQPENHGQPAGRRKIPLPWLLASGGVIVVVAVVLAVTLTGGRPDMSSPMAAAQAAAAAIGDNDVDDMLEIACAEKDGDFEEDFVAVTTEPTGSPIQSAEAGEVTEADSEFTATSARIELTFANEVTKNFAVLMAEENGGWCISAISF